MRISPHVYNDESDVDRFESGSLGCKAQGEHIESALPAIATVNADMAGRSVSARGTNPLARERAAREGGASGPR
jgi:hypothetical protein